MGKYKPEKKCWSFLLGEVLGYPHNVIPYSNSLHTLLAHTVGFFCKFLIYKVIFFPLYTNKILQIVRLYINILKMSANTAIFSTVVSACNNTTHFLSSFNNILNIVTLYSIIFHYYYFHIVSYYFSIPHYCLFRQHHSRLLVYTLTFSLLLVHKITFALLLVHTAIFLTIVSPYSNIRLIVSLYSNILHYC